jgi:hypothetical protein
MEILQCEINGVKGWQCGENGVCYIGTDAMQRAFREQARLKAEEFEKNPAPLPKPEPKEEKKQEIEEPKPEKKASKKR